MDHSVYKSAGTRANRRLRVLVLALSLVVLGLITYIFVGGAGGSPENGLRGASGSRASSTTDAAKARRSLVTRNRGGGVVETPSVLVGVTTAGVLEDLDPRTGAPLRALASGASGDELSVTPDGSNVYFETGVGCMHEIERVPIAGGSPQVVATGSVPGLSPDGSELAYMRQPLSDEGSCQGQTGSASMYALVVRDLADGSETTYPVAPQLAGGPPDPVDHLSWSADGRELAVSIAGGPSGRGWELALVHPATDDYYFTGTGVPVTGDDAAVSYYREGIYMPDGELFVNRVCCDGPGDTVTSTLMMEVDPSNGVITRQVALGILGNDHKSLDADPSGHWLLYLSGHELFVSENGERPVELTAGFSAAAW